MWLKRSSALMARINTPRHQYFAMAGVGAALFGLVLAGPAFAEPRYGIAMLGEPALPADFTAYPHVNQDAPKGGRMTFANLGSFDSLNPFIIKGRAPSSIRSNVFENLLDRNYSEPFTMYARIAMSIETPDDRSWATFRLDPDARFSDGRPIRAADVVFSWEALKTKGRPNHRSAYSKVARVETPDDLTIKFIFGPDGDRELPLILALMPILPKHIYEKREFEASSLEIPVGSGPYMVADVKPGKSITFKRDPNWWGANLPINRGRYNFDELVYEYYRDSGTRNVAFTKGLFDFQQEWDPTNWSTGYDFPAVKDGRVVLETFERKTPTGMLALAFNTRREIFADKRVRQALTMLFDFEWANTNLFHGLYRRTESYFQGSDLSALSVPASAAEVKLLAPFPGSVDADVMDGTYRIAKTDGSGRDRKVRRKAIALFAEAGWKIKDGTMSNAENGKPFTFEILVAQKRQERYALTYAKTLKTLAGIEITVRQVDSAQYQERRQKYDFDMVEHFWYASLSPGNEQNFYWSVSSADTDGTRNYPGIRDPAIDAMIKVLLEARTRESFADAARALDRVLISGR
ncbi:MAG: extracellular solute-binding protein, partial [Halocynthiibacter sp.]